MAYFFESYAKKSYFFHFQPNSEVIGGKNDRSKFD